jgi:membrane protein DedA with SNARE-associated domain
MEHWVTTYGYLAIFLLMVAESACIPFPSEVTMMVGGWYAAEGELALLGVILAGVVGNVVGSWLAYGLGYKTGRSLLDRYGRYVLIRSHDIDKAEQWWDRHGEAATFFSRLLPVLRTFISLPAGMARMPFWRFTLYTILGVIPWTAALALAGALVKDHWERLLPYFDWPTAIIVGVILLIAIVGFVRKRRSDEGSG